MRLALLVLVLGYVIRWIITSLDACETFGHDAHWVTPTLRTCGRCPQTWRRDPGDIAATTTNQVGGW